MTPMQHTAKMSPGPRLSIKTVFPRYGDSLVNDKTVVRPSYLEHGDPYNGKTTSLYWDRPLVFWACVTKRNVTCVYGRKGIWLKKKSLFCLQLNVRTPAKFNSQPRNLVDKPAYYSHEFIRNYVMLTRISTVIWTCITSELEIFSVLSMWAKG